MFLFSLVVSSVSYLQRFCVALVLCFLHVCICLHLFWGLFAAYGQLPRPTPTVILYNVNCPACYQGSMGCRQCHAPRFDESINASQKIGGSDQNMRRQCSIDVNNCSLSPNHLTTTCELSSAVALLQHTNTDDIVSWPDNKKQHSYFFQRQFARFNLIFNLLDGGRTRAMESECTKHC